MKFKDLVTEMSLPMVNDLQTATDMIQKANAAAQSGQFNQDVMGGLEASMKWLMQQPRLGQDPNLTVLKNRALAAKKRLDSFRTGKATQQAQFSGAKPVTNAWGVGAKMKTEGTEHSKSEARRLAIQKPKKDEALEKKLLKKGWQKGPDGKFDPDLGKKKKLCMKTESTEKPSKADELRSEITKSLEKGKRKKKVTLPPGAKKKSWPWRRDWL